jgi:hypothetical protein
MPTLYFSSRDSACFTTFERYDLNTKKPILENSRMSFLYIVIREITRISLCGTRVYPPPPPGYFNKYSLTSDMQMLTNNLREIFLP